MTPLGGIAAPAETSLTDRVLDATLVCCERWGQAKVTIDDIAGEAGCSRATLYRLFPGGRDTLFEALRARQTAEFFAALSEQLTGASGYEELVVRSVVEATRSLEADQGLKVMLASEPGEVAHQLTVEGFPRIVAVGTELLTPFFAPHIGEARSAQLAEWLSRVVLSYFLAPSAHVELSDVASATAFVRSFVLPAFPPSRDPSPER